MSTHSVPYLARRHLRCINAARTMIKPPWAPPFGYDPPAAATLAHYQATAPGLFAVLRPRGVG